MRTQTDRLLRPFIGTALLLLFGLAPGSLTTRGALSLRDVLTDSSPSRGDTERIERGYYEQILEQARTLDQANSPDVDPSAPRFGNPFIREERLTIQVNDIREYVSRPNLRRDVPNQIPWTTNSRGMRDLEYAKSKPRNTYRIGFAGDSIGMGWGVGDDEFIEPRLEAIFNNRSRAAGGPTVEVLNFAVPGHGPGQRWHHFASEAWGYQPDLVIFESSPADPGWDERRLRPLLARNIGFDAPVYRKTLANACIQPGLDSKGYRAKLKPLKWELLEGVYREAAEECRARGVPCVWILVPRVGKPMETTDRRRIVELARRAGFDAVIDASDAFAGLDLSTLSVGSKDYHPNSRGHEFIVKHIEPLLSRVAPLARLWGNSQSPELLSDRRIGSSKLVSETQ